MAVVSAAPGLSDQCPDPNRRYVGGNRSCSTNPAQGVRPGTVHEERWEVERRNDAAPWRWVAKLLPAPDRLAGTPQMGGKQHGHPWLGPKGV